jgi:hypothetical protein
LTWLYLKAIGKEKIVHERLRRDVRPETDNRLPVGVPVLVTLICFLLFMLAVL